jgi:membrane-bound lytic murein transglycosylase A
VRLEDGALLRVNYDAHNGHPYTPVGRILIERGEVPREEMSMQRIRQWMLADAEKGRELRRQNKSFIFFRVVGLSSDEEARGGQGVSLTPGRSIAVDRPVHSYGMPFWIEAELPIESDQPTTKFRRLLIAQDTGSAIVGPARGDIYFGAGDEAETVAGRLRHAGRFAMLVPREIDPAKVAAYVPLPAARPDMKARIAASENATPLPPVKPSAKRSWKRRR